MYNQDIPAQNELPSTKQLVKSTFIASIIAGFILITAILPAEYGIDPTGIGRTLGLVEMAEIKASLAAEDEAEQQNSTVSINPVVIDVKVENKIKTVTENQSSADNKVIAVKTDTKIFILKPGQATEIKLGMKKDDTINYQWVTNSGVVNFDTHGDAKDISYHGYGKGRGVNSDKGVLKAAFDGNHGWFWRNRTKQDIEITLMTEGQYKTIKRVL